jgi:fructose-specific phosphotransferase system component IIB
MKIVAVTSCPTGIAHTLMAAEALKKTAEVMGHEIKVETQGSVGTRNLSPELSSLGLARNIEEMERDMNDPTALQKAHRDYLLKLQGVVK